jgi:peptidyl-prolyl cis-trans isomerase-like 2
LAEASPSTLQTIKLLTLSRNRQHSNTHPVTNEPLTPADLIQLHYARKASGEYHDPISFKPFNQHSHIVAIATTGNVFLAESINSGVDLVDDVRFEKYVLSCCDSPSHLFSTGHRGDVITLQNPHGLPSASVSTTKALVTQKDKVVATVKPAAAGPVSAAQKEAAPCLFRPSYSFYTALISVTKGIYLLTRPEPLAPH